MYLVARVERGIKIAKNEFKKKHLRNHSVLELSEKNKKARMKTSFI